MLKVKVICSNCMHALVVACNIPNRGCDWQLMVVPCQHCRPTTGETDLAKAPEKMWQKEAREGIKGCTVYPISPSSLP